MEKKLRQSPIVITLYVIAALVMVYAIYLVGSTVSYIFSYYSQYSMSPEFGETIGYVLQSTYQPIATAVLLFAAGYILNEVRALNPMYYATDEEVAQAKAAKKLAKESKAEKAEAVESQAVVFEAAADKVEEVAEETAETVKIGKKAKKKTIKA